MVLVYLSRHDEATHQALCALYFASVEYKQLIESEYHGPIFSYGIYDWGATVGLLNVREYMSLVRYEQFVCSPGRY